MLRRLSARWVISRKRNNHPLTLPKYRRFWADHNDVPAPWISLLFGIMGLGAFFCLRAGEELPHLMQNHTDVIKVYQRRATDCLLISKYSTSPGPYTMEALLMNAQNEFLRRRDAHLGVWILGGIAIRLGLRMGYRMFRSPPVPCLSQPLRSYE